MLAQKTTMSRNAAQEVGAIALRLPEVEKGVACEGTSVERSTFKVAGCKVGASGRTRATV
jgi:hypothetical protein